MMMVPSAGSFSNATLAEFESKIRAMIIRITARNRSIEIDEPRNFKAFLLRIEGQFDDPAVRAELLGRVAVRCDREHAWISEQVLRDWPKLESEPWWQDGLAAMIASVERFGWIDSESRSIRAHIDHAP
jgi:predicted transcriptional regulator